MAGQVGMYNPTMALATQYARAAVPLGATAYALGNIAGRAYDWYTSPTSRIVRSALRRFPRRSWKPSTIRKARRYSRKTRSRKPKSQHRELKKRVNNLSKTVSADTGTHIFRGRDVGKNLAAEKVISQSQSALSMQTIESFLNDLRYYDPSTPATLLTASASSGTFSKPFLFKSIYTRFTVRNNYVVPVKATVYCCVTKNDTNILPLTAFTNGLTDIGAPSSTSPLVYLTDSLEFNRLWKIQSSKTKVLQGGQELVLTYSKKNVSFDPAFLDDHGDDYQAAYGCHVYIIRCEGVVGHTGTLIGNLPGGVDWYRDTTAVVKYSAGANIKTIKISDNQNAVTSAGYATTMPISDNVQYNAS